MEKEMEKEENMIIKVNWNLKENLKMEKGGYIKEFFCFDELSFENEYFNGERNGKGKEYH